MYPNGHPARTAEPNESPTSTRDSRSRAPEVRRFQAGRVSWTGEIAARSRAGTHAIARPADQTVLQRRIRRAGRRSVRRAAQRFVALLATFFAAGFVDAAFLVATFLAEDRVAADFATGFTAPPLLDFFASLFPSGPRPVLASVFT